MLRKIKRTDAVALAMLTSQSFSADGGNQKPGIGGKRVMHALCSCSMAWHSGIHGRAPKTDRPDWANGGLAHRRLALTVVQQTQWRGLDWCVCVLSNFDGTNTFGATRLNLLISTSQQAAIEKDCVCDTFCSTREHDIASVRRLSHAWEATATIPGCSSGFSDFAQSEAPTLGLKRATVRALEETCGHVSCANFMDDISRIQKFAAPPSVAEVVFKMNSARSVWEESPSKGDWIRRRACSIRT